MKVYCPYCKKDVDYEIEKRDVKDFKGIELNTFENVAVCKKCHNDLYVNELEEKNNKRINDLYREKASIIKPQDIVKLREKYDISQRELTAILGFGKMTINRYERGGVPTKSQSDYLKLLINNDSKFIEKVKEAFNNGNISEKTYNRIVSKELRNEEEYDIKGFVRRYLKYSLNRKPDIYNGYKELDIEKLENIISYVASKVKTLTITSLNKYLWFIDMLYFNQETIAVTGLTYQKQKFGPTIIDGKYDELTMLDDKFTREDIENKDGNVTKIIISKGNYDLSCISDKEKETIDMVIKLLKDKTVSEISELSHKEDGWKKTKMYERISFEYAMNLKFNK